MIAMALIHMLWQAALVGAAYALIRPLLRQAPVRYVAACVALFSLPFIFLATLAAMAARPASPLAAPSWAASPWVVAVWLAGMVAVATYSTAGWIIAQRLRRRVSFNVPGEWHRCLHALSLRMNVRARVRLGLSAAVSGPCTFGSFRPWILLPMAALTSLPPGQLEALLAHELAHVRRHDYFVNLLQRAVEVVFFFHPAVWWLSHEISEVREHCCDELAVEACGDRLGYARALVNLAEWRAGLVLAAAGGSLPRRVRSILAGPGPRQWRGVALAFGATAIGLVLFLGAPRRVKPMPPPAAAPSPAALAVPTVHAVPAAIVKRSPPLPRQRVTHAARAVPSPAPVPAPATPQLHATAVAYTLALVPSCSSQVRMVPQVLPDGSLWLVPQTVNFCQPVLRPVEVLVLTST